MGGFSSKPSPGPPSPKADSVYYTPNQSRHASTTTLELTDEFKKNPENYTIEQLTKPSPSGEGRVPNKSGQTVLDASSKPKHAQAFREAAKEDRIIKAMLSSGNTPLTVRAVAQLKQIVAQNSK